MSAHTSNLVTFFWGKSLVIIQRIKGKYASSGPMYLALKARPQKPRPMIVHPFFFAKRERALLITHETCYILSQLMTPCVGEPAHATLLSVTCVSLAERVHERFHFVPSSQIGISPLLAF